MDRLIYRISATRYAESMSGSGREARWNRENQFVLYTSSSMSLACLEMLVNCSGDLLATDLFSISTWFLPGSIKTEEVFADDLERQSANWHQRDSYEITQQLAERWLDDENSAVMKVPSAIVDTESNFLINPKHPSAREIKLLRIQPFRFDQRLKTG